ncbi:CRISPR-associated endonuclease Cas2 [Planctopirus limnophila]|nr:CRISPR-associated endonuclease Cas2 [Planctopirus limnophila]
MIRLTGFSERTPMKNVYLISYDVSDAKRLRLTHRKLCGFGTSLQYSVFRCELSKLQLMSLKEGLWEILNLVEDRVMVVDLGPAGARGDDCVEFWGNPRTEIPERKAFVI